MHRHWDRVIEPLLAALGEGPIIEIGAEAGRATVKLAEFAEAREIVVHAVDPTPQCDVDELEQRFAGCLHFHRQPSHAALERIGPAASVLIDGDHNWHTVHGELTRLASLAAASNRPFPLVMLHDVDWPYARRDMYYDPDAIPDDVRKPWARRGIKWGQKVLDDEGGGVNPHLANAIESGGPKNGVLTAVEDFVAECGLPLELRIVHGDAGLGVLVPQETLENLPALRDRWDALHSSRFLLAQAQRLSESAAEHASRRIEATRELRGLEANLKGP